MSGLTMLAAFFLLSTPTFAEYQYVSQFGETGPIIGQFRTVTEITVDSQGKLLIADRENDRVQICSQAGECTVLGDLTPPLLRNPYGISEDQQGRIVVTESFVQRSQVQVCQRDVVSVCDIEFGGPGSALGQFSSPRGVVVDRQNRVIIVDRGNSRIQICDQEGTNCSAFGSSGNGVGQFSFPSGVALDDEGNIIIADESNHRIQICSYQGSCSAFGSPGSSVGQFTNPTGVALDWAGRIIVTDRLNKRVQVCDYTTVQNQVTCTVLGGSGSGNGQFQNPVGVAADQSGNFFVGDDFLNRVQVFYDPEFENKPFKINAGLNDAWYNPDTDGQGFFITVFPDLGYVSMAWFTYDTQLPPQDATANLGDPGHRWITALGLLEGNKSVMSISVTSGGIFDTPTEITRVDDGTITLTFESCNAATVEYNIPSINQQSTIPVVRVAADNIALCEALSD